jgi:protein involved in polysaccharide export with SLBB domain
MDKLNKLIAIALVVQLALGAGGGLAWGQSTGDGSGSSKSKLAPTQHGGAVKKGKGQAPGGGGVESASPALDKLPGGRALSRAVVPDQYILGPGDGLTVNLWGEFEDLYEVRVTPDGKISLPTLGDLKVKGLSLTQAAALIEVEVNKYYRHVKSGISLTSLRIFEVSVLGSIQSPGTYLATPVRRVSDLIAEAGGVIPGGSWRKIQVRRDDQVVAIADLTSYLRRGHQTANPYVKDGDILFVPPMEDMVVSMVTNDVVTSQSGTVIESSTPNKVEMQEGEHISQLISELGSVSPWWNLEGAYVLRETYSPEGTMKIPVNLHRILYDKENTQDIELKDGDQVFIPSNVRRVFVNGLVRTGGAFPYVPNRTAEEYLGLAGGVSLQASMERSTIRRADGTVELFSPGAILQSGDAIQVEQKYFATPSDYVGVIGGITGLVFSMFAFLSTLR